MTLEELEDRRAITELVHRSAYALDDKDFSAMAACFTEDATLDHGPEAVTPVLRGRDTIVGLAARTHDGADGGRPRLAQLAQRDTAPGVRLLRVPGGRDQLQRGHRVPGHRDSPVSRTRLTPRWLPLH